MIICLEYLVLLNFWTWWIAISHPDICMGDVRVPVLTHGVEMHRHSVTRLLLSSVVFELLWTIVNHLFTCWGPLFWFWNSVMELVKTTSLILLPFTELSSQLMLVRPKCTICEWAKCKGPDLCCLHILDDKTKLFWFCWNWHKMVYLQSVIMKFSLQAYNDCFKDFLNHKRGAFLSPLCPLEISS
jgi:hypothetical protein